MKCSLCWDSGLGVYLIAHSKVSEVTPWSGIGSSASRVASLKLPNSILAKTQLEIDSSNLWHLISYIVKRKFIFTFQKLQKWIFWLKEVKKNFGFTKPFCLRLWNRLGKCNRRIHHIVRHVAYPSGNYPNESTLPHWGWLPLVLNSLWVSSKEGKKGPGPATTGTVKYLPRSKKNCTCNFHTKYDLYCECRIIYQRMQTLKSGLLNLIIIVNFLSRARGLNHFGELPK
jgi:hypothetical protein